MKKAKHVKVPKASFATHKSFGHKSMAASIPAGAGVATAVPPAALAGMSTPPGMADDQAPAGMKRGGKVKKK